jgi:hypothetical protein
VIYCCWVQIVGYPVLAVRLPRAIIAEVDLVAEQRGCGRSEAVRRLLEDALAMPSEEAVEGVAAALERGDVEATLRAIGLDPMQLQHFARSITDAFEAGGKAALPAKRKAMAKQSSASTHTPIPGGNYRDQSPVEREATTPSKRRR